MAVPAPSPSPPAAPAAGRSAPPGRQRRCPSLASTASRVRRREWKQLVLLELQEQALPDLDQRRRQQARRVVGAAGGEEGEIAHAVQQVAAAAAPRVGAHQVDDRGDQVAVGLQLLGVPARQLLEALAQVAAVDPQVAVEVAGELGEVAADVVLGEDEDVVAHPREEAGEEVLLDLLGGAGQPLHQVVGDGEHAVEVALEHPVADRLAVAAADLQVLADDALRGLLEEAGGVERVGEPEDRWVLAAVARARGVLAGAGEEGAVALPGEGVLLAVVGLARQDGELHPLLGGEIAAQRRPQLLDARRLEERKAARRGGALVVEEDLARQRQGPLVVGQEAAHLLHVRPQEVERPGQYLQQRGRAHLGDRWTMIGTSSSRWITYSIPADPRDA